MMAKRPTMFPLPIIGWKELVALPGLAPGRIVAKVDTGARTAALHAEAIKIFGRHANFTMFIGERNRRCSAEIVDVRRIKSSNGIMELRPVIETEIELGGQRFPTLVTLTDRTDMGVPMLLGRLALKSRFFVNPSRSFLLGRKGAQR